MNQVKITTKELTFKIRRHEPLDYWIKITGKNMNMLNAFSLLELTGISLYINTQVFPKSQVVRGEMRK